MFLAVEFSASDPSLLLFQQSSFIMVYQSKLSNQAQEIKDLVLEWIPKREKTIDTLQVLADQLLAHHNNVCIAQVAGSSASVLGFGFAAVGFGLSFVTAGVSLLLAGVGGVIGVAGGLTNTGASIARAYIQKGTFDTAQKIIKEDREAVEAIQNLWKKFEHETTTLSKVKDGAKVTFKVASAGCITASTGYKIGKSGLRVGAAAANGGGEALFRGLSATGKVLHIGGFAASAVLLPLDIYIMVSNSMEIDASRKGKKDKEPTAVKELRELAEKLAKEMPDKDEITRQLDDLITASSASSALEMIR